MKWVLVILSFAMASFVSGCGNSETKDKATIEEIYLIYQNAVHDGDIEKIKSLIGKSQRAEIEKAEDTDFVLKIMQAMTPKDGYVSGSSVENDAAQLIVKGTNEDGDEMEGWISLDKENNSWKITKIVWN
ncbi:hypothetical protein ACFL54_05980 [Planctomycetota bacterium]